MSPEQARILVSELEDAWGKELPERQLAVYIKHLMPISYETGRLAVKEAIETEEGRLPSIGRLIRHCNMIAAQGVPIGLSVAYGCQEERVPWYRTKAGQEALRRQEEFVSMDDEEYMKLLESMARGRKFDQTAEGA